LSHLLSLIVFSTLSFSLIILLASHFLADFWHFQADLPTPMARPQQESSPAQLPYQHKVNLLTFKYVFYLVIIIRNSLFPVSFVFCNFAGVCTRTPALPTQGQSCFTLLCI
jgi:hypothetical protein